MYDYIVVGGGTSGCVLAAELPADPAVRVLLPEAGGRGGGPLFAIPKASIFVTESSKRYSYLYETEAVAPAGRPGIWLRGRVLGGSSATSGMIYNRGWRDDGDDQRRTFALLRRLREIAAADPLAAMVDAEAAPRDTVVDDRTIAGYALGKGLSGFHTVGACG